MAASTSTAPETTASSAAAASSLRTQILKQGKPADHVPSGKPVLGKPGKYVVSLGSMTLGYEADGERVVAHPGAVVNLTAEEAGPLVLAGTVRRLEES